MTRAKFVAAPTAGFPAPLSAVVDLIARIPGIGRKTAERHALWFATGTGGSEAASQLGTALTGLAESVEPCSRCGHVADVASAIIGSRTLCAICRDGKRDQAMLCVVAKVQDLLAIERCGVMRGRYYVLGCLLSPLDGISGDDLPLDGLDAVAGQAAEILLALPATVEGNATSLLLSQRYVERGYKVTRIATGMPHGGDLEFADPVTLGSAIGGRLAM